MTRLPTYASLRQQAQNAVEGNIDLQKRVHQIDIPEDFHTVVSENWTKRKEVDRSVMTASAFVGN